jgi:predicted regulator of Ras-like GTPase activity (Roadblock/LC7/MglB family)
MTTDIVMYEEEFRRIDGELQNLRTQANARLVFLVDKNGQLIASAGDTQNMDTTSLASLTAGNIAATGGIAKLLGEREFTILFHEGEKDNINMILCVIFDSRSSIGLVRLRVRKATESLTKIFEHITEKSAAERAESKEESPFSAISDEDIDNLFK